MYNVIVQNNAGEEYDLSAQAMPHRAKLHQAISHELQKEFSGRKIGQINVLEIGCGTGYTTSIMLNCDPRTRVISVDKDSAMIQFAANKLKAYGARVQFFHCDALEFLRTQKQGYFNVFASAMTLHNFEQEYRVSVLNEIYRVLGAKGLFVNADKYAVDDISQHSKALDWQISQLEKVLSNAGRQDLAVQWVNHYIDDEAPEKIMGESHSSFLMHNIGFRNVEIKSRAFMEAVMTARK